MSEKNQPDTSNQQSGSPGSESVRQVTSEISSKSRQLDAESRKLRRYHQTYTILTILLGVSAPALVTYSPPAAIEAWWRLGAVAVTAFAAASATIRTVLRFSERYSNSALTSIALLDLESQVQAMQQDYITTVMPQYREQKLFEVSAWARKGMFDTMKAYVEKDVSALTQQRIELPPAPEVKQEQKIDNTRQQPAFPGRS